MQIRLANHSSYPVGKTQERRPATPATVPSNLTEVIREQESAGLDIVTDGRAAVLPWMRSLSGIRFPRGFDSLDPLRARPRPVAESRPRQVASLLVEGWHEASRLAHCAVKPTILGPYSLARLCAITAGDYGDWRPLAGDLAAILAEEVRQLGTSGARLIQIEEPVILAHPDDIRALREVLEPVYAAAAERIQVAMVTYGADAGALFAHLNSTPCDILGVEIVGRPEALQTIAEAGSAKILALGIIGTDAAADPDALARSVERALHHYVHDTLYLQPAVGLGRLSPAEAADALRTLVATRARVEPR